MSADGRWVFNPEITDRICFHTGTISTLSRIIIGRNGKLLYELRQCPTGAERKDSWQFTIGSLVIFNLFDDHLRYFKADPVLPFTGGCSDMGRNRYFIIIQKGLTNLWLAFKNIQAGISDLS